jgi:hypothetical protein
MGYVSIPAGGALSNGDGFALLWAPPLRLGDGYVFAEDDED